MKDMGTFLKEVRVELTRVEWPKREEYVGATIVTLVLVAFFTVFLGIVDKISQWLIYKQLFKYVGR